MAVFVVMAVGAMMLSSFDVQKQETEVECSQLDVCIPEKVVLYDGKAWLAHMGYGSQIDAKFDMYSIDIKVFQMVKSTDIVFVEIAQRNCKGDACSEPYAFALKENPKYNPNDDRKVSEMKYYVTFNNKDWFFDM